MAKCINCNKNAYYRQVDNERKTRTHCRACKEPGMIHHRWCKHGKRKTECKDEECRATATDLCKHGKHKTECKEDEECRANASALCKHDNRKAQCKEDEECRVNASGLCEHGKQRATCTREPCCYTACRVCQICCNRRIQGSYTVGDVRSCATCFHADFHTRLNECATPAQRLALFRKPSNRRIKEIRIAGDLVEAFGDRGWDSQGYTADCDDTLTVSEAMDSDSALGGLVRLKWYFTDMESFLGDGNTILVVEIDEHQHKQYDASCEYNRMLGVVAAHRGKRVLFARFNPDEYSRHGLKIASTFTKNADGLLEPNDLYEHSMAFFVQCVRDLCSGSLLCLDDSNGLAGVMYVNYSTDSPAVAYASDKLGPSNVCQLYWM